MQYSNGTTLRDIVTNHLMAGQISILRITGQAGAGKTNHVVPLIKQVARERDFWVGEIPLDAFFKLSSEDRAQWLVEGERIDPEEAARRRDQLTWWDFAKAQQVLDAVKNGKSVHLRDIYNRADRGRLTGNLSLDVPCQGLILFEGVAVAHIPGEGSNLYVHAPKHVRFPRLVERDRHRGAEEARKRFELTEEFEKRYFTEHWHLIHHYVNNSRNGAEDLPVLAKPDSYILE